MQYTCRPVGKADTLVVHEIYASIQGESTFAGIPCTFVRTTGCNLRCVWCDTPQAFYRGTRMRREDVVQAVMAHETPLVEITGGEPLLQPGVVPLLSELCDLKRTVLLETSGEADLSPVDARVHKVMDLKCPGSGESHRNRWSNLDHVGPRDELKFVLADCVELRMDAHDDSRTAPARPNAELARKRCLRATSAERIGPLGARGCGPCARPASNAQVHLGGGRDGRLRRLREPTGAKKPAGPRRGPLPMRGGRG